MTVRSTILVLFALSLVGCGAVPIKPALDLAEAGTTLTKTASASLGGVSKDIAAIPERQQVRRAIERCMSAIQDARAQTPPKTPICNPPGDAPDGVIEANQKLAALMLGRAKMLDALTGAYGALEAEANYKARSDLEGAISELGAPAKALSGLAQSAGLGPLPGLDLIVPIAAHLGGLAAEQAQKKRLIQASQSIRGAVIATQAAVKGEAQLYGAISGAVDDNRSQVTDALIAAGLLDPKPAVQTLLAELNAGLSPDAKATDLNLIAASRAVSRHRSRAAGKAKALSYLKLDAAFGELVQAHVDFEADAAKPLVELESSIAEFGFWSETLAKLQAATKD